jgi:FkbM family methyltransferase
MLSQIRARARKLHHYLMPRSAFKRILATQAGTEVELSLLPALVDRSRAAVDVGANAGVYSLQLSQLVTQVHAFEPHPRMARILRANMPSNVTIRQAAVSDVDGQARLRFPVHDGFESDVLGTIDPANTAVASADFRTIEVATVRLDSLALASIGFVKIDVEGHELSVLLGAKDTLRRDKPTLLIEAEERHRTGAVGSISSFLAGYGYSGMFVLDGRLHALDEFDDAGSERHDAVGSQSLGTVYNFIFSHESHKSRVAEGVRQILGDGVPR